jgi:hypothetical protein
LNQGPRFFELSQARRFVLDSRFLITVSSNLKSKWNFYQTFIFHLLISLGINNIFYLLGAAAPKAAAAKAAAPKAAAAKYEYIL